MTKRNFISILLCFLMILSSILIVSMPSYAESNNNEVTEVSCGPAYTGILKKDGSLWMVGANSYGQLGDGTTEAKTSPVKVMENVAQVSCGNNSTGVVKKDGSLWVTGRNDYGQLGDGTTEDKHSWVKIMDDVEQVTFGYYHTGIIKKDGSLWMAGNNGNGQSGPITYADYIPEKVLSPQKVMDDVIQVSCGEHHTGILKKDGSLWMAGRNDVGQQGDGQTNSNISPVKIMDGVLQVSCGASHTGILKKDGSLWMTGSNSNGQLGDPDTMSFKRTPYKIMDGVLQISCIGLRTGILKEDGSLWMLGKNTYGAHGDSTTEDRTSPVKVMDGVAKVCCGSNHTGVLKQDGSLWMAGRNKYGQLLDGTTEDKHSFIIIDASDISNEGSNWEWGKDNYPFINDGAFFGDSRYISNEDFLTFLSKCSNADIKRMAAYYGKADDYHPHIHTSLGYRKNRLCNFLQNNLVEWKGSCNGMALTAAFFKTGIYDPIDFGAAHTYLLDNVKAGEDTDLESFINIYHISQFCSWNIYNEKNEEVKTKEFPGLIDELYSKARLINDSKHEIIVVTLYEKNPDGTTDGHTVLCFGAEDGQWSFIDKTYNRRLLIADPNEADTSYIYISSDSKDAYYYGYSEFGYIDLKLETQGLIANYERPNSLPLLISTNKNIVIVGDDGRGKLIIENGKIRIEGSSSNKWIADMVSLKGDSTDIDGNNTIIRLFSDSESFTVMPYEGEELGVSLFFRDIAVDIEGKADSAVAGNDGSVVLNGAEGEVSVGLTFDNSKLDFSDVEGTANGDVTITPDQDSVIVSGDISDYTFTNIDRKANEIEVTVPGDADKKITLNDQEELVILDDHSTCDHEYGEWKLVKEPTCSETGKQERVCLKCDSKEVKVVPLTEHTYGPWKTTSKATETAKGEKTRTCSVCGGTETKTIAMLKPTLKAVKILKPVAAKKAATIKWKKISKTNLKKIKKVQIQYSMDKNFKKGVKTKYASAKKTSYKLTKLKSKKKYYVRIRAYTKKNGVVHVSKWSSKKPFKVK